MGQDQTKESTVIAALAVEAEEAITPTVEVLPLGLHRVQIESLHLTQLPMCFSATPSIGQPKLQLRTAGSLVIADFSYSKARLNGNIDSKPLLSILREKVLFTEPKVQLEVALVDGGNLKGAPLAVGTVDLAALLRPRQGALRTGAHTVELQCNEAAQPQPNVKVELVARLVTELDFNALIETAMADANSAKSRDASVQTGALLHDKILPDLLSEWTLLSSSPTTAQSKTKDFLTVVRPLVDNLCNHLQWLHRSKLARLRDANKMHRALKATCLYLFRRSNELASRDQRFQPAPLDFHVVLQQALAETVDAITVAKRLMKQKDLLSDKTVAVLQEQAAALVKLCWAAAKEQHGGDVGMAITQTSTLGGMRSMQSWLAGLTIDAVMPLLNKAPLIGSVLVEFAKNIYTRYVKMKDVDALSDSLLGQCHRLMVLLTDARMRDFIGHYDDVEEKEKGSEGEGTGTEEEDSLALTIQIRDMMDTLFAAMDEIDTLTREWGESGSLKKFFLAPEKLEQMQEVHKCLTTSFDELTKFVTLRAEMRLSRELAKLSQTETTNTAHLELIAQRVETLVCAMSGAEENTEKQRASLAGVKEQLTALGEDVKGIQSAVADAIRHAAEDSMQTASAMNAQLRAALNEDAACRMSQLEAHLVAEMKFRDEASTARIVEQLVQSRSLITEVHHDLTRAISAEGDRIMEHLGLRIDTLREELLLDLDDVARKAAKSILDEERDERRREAESRKSRFIMGIQRAYRRTFDTLSITGRDFAKFEETYVASTITVATAQVEGDDDESQTKNAKAVSRGVSEKTTSEILELAGQHRRSVIILEGTAGVGKSSLGRQLARRGLPEEPDVVVLFVPLVLLDAGGATKNVKVTHRRLLDVAFALLSDVDGDDDLHHQVDALVKRDDATRFVWILDGLDEMHDRKELDLFLEFESLEEDGAARAANSSYSPKHRYIVATRFDRQRDIWRKMPHLKVELTPWSTRHVKSFVSKYFDAVMSATDTTTQNSQEASSRLKSTAERVLFAPACKSWSGVPIMCDMVCCYVLSHDENDDTTMMSEAGHEIGPFKVIDAIVDELIVRILKKMKLEEKSRGVKKAETDTHHPSPLIDESAVELEEEEEVRAIEEVKKLALQKVISNTPNAESPNISPKIVFNMEFELIDTEVVDGGEEEEGNLRITAGEILRRALCRFISVDEPTAVRRQEETQKATQGQRRRPLKVNLANRGLQSQDKNSTTQTAARYRCWFTHKSIGEFFLANKIARLLQTPQYQPAAPDEYIRLAKQRMMIREDDDSEGREAIPAAIHLLKQVLPVTLPNCTTIGLVAEALHAALLTEQDDASSSSSENTSPSPLQENTHIFATYLAYSTRKTYGGELRFNSASENWAAERLGAHVAAANLRLFSSSSGRSDLFAHLHAISNAGFEHAAKIDLTFYVVSLIYLFAAEGSQDTLQGMRWLVDRRSSMTVVLAVASRALLLVSSVALECGDQQERQKDEVRDLQRILKDEYHAEAPTMLTAAEGQLGEVALKLALEKTDWGHAQGVTKEVRTALLALKDGHDALWKVCAERMGFGPKLSVAIQLLSEERQLSSKLTDLLPELKEEEQTGDVISFQISNGDEASPVNFTIPLPSPRDAEDGNSVMSISLSTCPHLVALHLAGVWPVGTYEFLQGSSNLTELTFRDTGTTNEVATEAYFLFRCNQLRRLQLPETCIAIGESFAVVTGLEHLSLPHKLLRIGEKFCSSCRSLRTITFRGDELHELGDGFMMMCSQLTEFTLPPKVHVVPARFLVSCTSLTSVQLHDDVSEIGDDFLSETAIAHFSLPKKVTKIPDRFLASCTFLRRVTLHDNVTSIGADCLSNCTSLEEGPVPLPSALRLIGPRFLHGVVPFEREVVIPSHVKVQESSEEENNK